jgi:hypothetical protein
MNSLLASGAFKNSSSWNDSYEKRHDSESLNLQILRAESTPCKTARPKYQNGTRQKRKKGKGGRGEGEGEGEGSGRGIGRGRG